MSANPTPRLVSVEEYLEQERHAELPSEYYRGEILPMFGTSPEHARIAANVIIALGARLKG